MGPGGSPCGRGAGRWPDGSCKLTNGFMVCGHMGTSPWTDRLTDMTKNITFSQTTYAGSNTTRTMYNYFYLGNMYEIYKC